MSVGGHCQGDVHPPVGGVTARVLFVHLLVVTARVLFVHLLMVTARVMSVHLLVHGHCQGDVRPPVAGHCQGDDRPQVFFKSRLQRDVGLLRNMTIQLTTVDRFNLKIVIGTYRILITSPVLNPFTP